MVARSLYGIVGGQAEVICIICMKKKNVFNSRTYTCGGSEEEFVWCSKVCVWCSKVRAFYKLFCIGFVLYFFQV